MQFYNDLDDYFTKNLIQIELENDNKILFDENDIVNTINRGNVIAKELTISDELDETKYFK